MVVYCLFFNEKVTLIEALALNDIGIIKLFQEFAASDNDNDENKYGVQKEARKYIKNAVSMIKTLHDRYKNRLGPTSDGPDPNPGYIEEPIGLTVGYQDNEFKLRTLYDIVGWIFSVVGKVPDRANRENYYYALMMIAYAFCTKLLSAKKTPEVWMVMWFEQMDNYDKKPVTRVVLGANLDKPQENVKEDTKNFRKDLLIEAGILVWRDGMSIPMERMEPEGIIKGQDFGHCAESYPLLFICSLAKNRSEAFEIRGSAEGISVLAPTLYKSSRSTILDYKDEHGEVTPRILAPCNNCKYMMVRNGFTVAGFEEGLKRLPGQW